MTTKAPAPRKSNRDPNATGGEFLRASDIPALMRGASFISAEVQDRSATRRAEADGIRGASVGKYGVDIPTFIGGQPYVVTLPVWVDDYAHLIEAWGDELPAWTGRTLALWPQEYKKEAPGSTEVKMLLRFCPVEEAVKNPPAQAPLMEQPKTWATPKPRAASNQE